MSKEKVIVAIDDMNKEEVFHFLNLYNSNLKTVKIGMELFYKYGRELIEEITSKYNIDIFLDLKLHDIPTTVEKSIRSLKNLKIQFLTIHLAGGREMITHALKARDEYLPNTKILGVSILTSLDDRDCQAMYGTTTEKMFNNLYAVAKSTLIDGVVSSAHDLAYLKSSRGKILSVCPGIVFDGDKSKDQKRTMTPKQAFFAGADYLVIGRSITTKPERLKKLETFL